MPAYVHPIDLGEYHARLIALGPEGIRRALADIGEVARHRWARAAQAALHTTLADYLFGLQPVIVSEDTAAITLVGVLPNLIEHGMDQVDLHNTLLSFAKVPIVPPGQRGMHMSKRGHLYRSIAFRHAIPSSQGLVAPRMGSAYARTEGAEKSVEIGKAIYAAAKKLTPSVTGFAPAAIGAARGAGRISGAVLGAGFGLAGRRWGGRLDQAAAEKIAPPLQNRVTGKIHSTSIYAGMYRMRPPEAVAGSYRTFRTISTAPASMGKWIRPKTAGKKFGEQVARDLGPLARQIIVALVESAGKGAA